MIMDNDHEKFDLTRALRGAARMDLDDDALAAELTSRAEREGLLDVAYAEIDSPVGNLLLANIFLLIFGLTGIRVHQDPLTSELALARNAGEVWGVEIVPEAIADAERNAELNQIGNAHFRAGDARTTIRPLVEEAGRPDLVVVDPEHEWVVSSSTLRSKSKNTAFDGWTMRGRARVTVSMAPSFFGMSSAYRDPFGSITGVQVPAAPHRPPKRGTGKGGQATKGANRTVEQTLCADQPVYAGATRNSNPAGINGVSGDARPPSRRYAEGWFADADPTNPAPSARMIP